MRRRIPVSTTAARDSCLELHTQGGSRWLVCSSLHRSSGKSMPWYILHIIMYIYYIYIISYILYILHIIIYLLYIF